MTDGLRELAKADFLAWATGTTPPSSKAEVDDYIDNSLTPGLQHAKEAVRDWLYGLVGKDDWGGAWFVAYHNDGWRDYDSYATKDEARRAADALRSQGNRTRVFYRPEKLWG